MSFFTSSAGMAALALIGTIGGSVIAVPEFESPLPKTEPVSFISRIEAKCPVLKTSPKWNYHSSCLERLVMEYTDISD